MFHKSLVHDVDAIVESSGLGADQRKNILREYVYFTERDMRHAFVGVIVHSGSETGPLAKKVSDLDTPPTEALQLIRRLVDLYHCESDAWGEWLGDYQHLVKSGELRRSEKWFQYEPTHEGLIRQYAAQKDA